MRPTASSIRPGFGALGEARAMTGGHVLGAARAEDLAGVERGAAGPGHAVGSSRLADGVAAVEAGRAPAVDGEAAVHVLILTANSSGSRVISYL